MKKLFFTQSALGKLGIALTFVLPTIGFAEYAGQALTSASTSSNATQDLNSDARVQVLRQSQDIMEGVQQWQATHDLNGKYEKAQKTVRARAAQESKAEEERLDSMLRSAKSANLSGLDNAMQQLMSATNGIQRKECKQAMDFSNMFRMSQGLKDFYSNLAGNLSKLTKDQAEDLAAKAQRLAAEEFARQNALEKDNPAQAQYKQETEDLNKAMKDPAKLVAYMKKQIESANANQQDALKKNIRALNQLMNSPVGMINLLAAIEKDTQMFTEFGTTMKNMVNATMKQVVMEEQNQIGNLQAACDQNHSSVVKTKNTVQPIIERFNNPTIKQQNLARLARAVKTKCDQQVDFTPVMNAVNQVDTNLTTALASNDPAAFFQALTQSTQTVGDSAISTTKQVKGLGLQCDVNGKWIDTLGQDQTVQGAKQAAQTGDMSSVIAQDPNQQGPATAQAAPRQPITSSIPALGQPGK